MIPYQDSPRQPLATYLRALTGHAGYTIDAAELPVTTGFYTDEIEHWVRTGAHHAALTHLLELLDSPIEHFRSVTPPDSEDDERLSYLEHRHAALRVERDRARAAFTDTCDALRDAYAAALLFPHDNAPADYSADLRSGLPGILWRLGLVEAPPSHPATFAVYRAYRGGDTIEVSIDPFADPGTQIITSDRRGAVRWMASFGPDTPLPVIADAVRAALRPASTT